MDGMEWMMMDGWMRDDDEMEMEWNGMEWNGGGGWNGMEWMEWNGMEWSGMDGMEWNGMG